MIKEVTGDILLSKADLLAHGISAQDPFDSGLALALIAAFVAGVSTGAFLGRKAGARRGPAVLAFVSLALALAATLAALAPLPAAILVLAFAMGAENTVFAQVTFWLNITTCASDETSGGMAIWSASRPPTANPISARIGIRIANIRKGSRQRW